MTERTQAEVLNRIDLFCIALQAFCNSRGKELPYSYVITSEVGKKNVRIVRRELWPNSEEPQHGSVHCFIDLATGNILKADGWKRPAPQVRGSIFKEDFDIGPGKAVGEFGAAYLR